MIKSQSLIIPLIFTTAVLTSCGGGGSETVSDLPEDAAATASDTATDVTAEATDAVTSTEGAVVGAIDPAAWQEIETNWDSQVASVKEAFPDLTEDEITGTAGKPDNMVSLVEQKYGITREEAQARVGEWASSL